MNIHERIGRVLHAALERRYCTIFLCQCSGADTHPTKEGDVVELADCGECGKPRIVRLTREHCFTVVLWEGGPAPT